MKARTPLGPKESRPWPDRSIGDFIRVSRRLSEAQVSDIAAHQRQTGVLFGEAAIALGLATRDDVIWALSQQFGYPYAQAHGAGLDEALTAAHDPFGEQAEIMRGLRSQLLLGPMSPEHPKHALAVLSPNPGDGKSFLASNLAIVFSQLGARTLLIDADLRAPRQHELFRISNETGLSNLLAGHIETPSIHLVPALPSLFVMPVGTLPPNPSELLQSAAFSLLLNELNGQFDHIIVDTPAASHGSDSRVLAAKCGIALVVARRRSTRLTDLSRLAADLRRGPASFAGALINEH